MFYDDFNVYPKSRPRAAKGGIKARSKRGAFVENWWSKRWIAVLESFNLGARLTRGRRYARQGQVLSIEVDCGKVTASVQGSRSRPYQVEIILKPFSKTEWKKVVSCLASQPVLMAGLLAGEMPDDIEDIFEDAGLSLFPENNGAWHHLCTLCMTICTYVKNGMTYFEEPIFQAPFQWLVAS